MRASRIAAARRPLALIGRGALADGVAAPLQRLIDRHRIPYFTTYKAKGLLPEDHALALGSVGLSPVVDAEALRAELTSGRLNAALDVTDPEPLPAGRAEWGLPNVLVTPHVGGDTFAFARSAPRFVAEQVTRHLAGRPLENVVRRPAS